MVQNTCEVLENVRLAKSTYRLRFRFPHLAEQIRPGQFLMLRIPGGSDPLLGRAFALYDTIPDSEGKLEAVEVVYLVVGKMTQQMAALKPRDFAEVWGPLGNGFPNYSGVDHLILVAGGIGYTPFLALLRQAWHEHKDMRTSFYYGVRNRDYVADLTGFGHDVHLASDDGSIGYPGFVTDLLDIHLSSPPYEGGAGGGGSALAAFQPPQSPLRKVREEKIHLVGCGPEPMLHALADLARRRKLPCDLSLETPMACGVGICFSCVTKVKTETGWDYRRVCVDGPVFDAESLAV